MKAFGFFVGLLSTLMGIGGGLFANLLMTFYGRPIHQAVATSVALAVLISIRGALSDQPAYRGSRRAGCARAVEAHARTCVRLPSVDRRQLTCAKLDLGSRYRWVGQE
jgi:hypothetical protein